MTGGRTSWKKVVVSDPASIPQESRVVIASWPRNARETIQVALDRYQDCDTIDLRTWFTAADGTERATKSGISLSVRHLPAVATAITAALVEARERGLLPQDEGGGA